MLSFDLVVSSIESFAFTVLFFYLALRYAFKVDLVCILQLKTEENTFHFYVHMVSPPAF
jgi:hypothetical protein